MSRAEELEVLRHKYAAVSDPRAKAAIAEYADELYGRGWREEPPAEGPSSVQGPGRVRGTGRIMLAFLDGRLKLFVDTHVSLVDIGDCAEGHLLAAERGAPGERYILNGMTLTVTEALQLAADVAGVNRHPRLVPRGLATAAGTAVERAFRLARRHPPVCREMVRTLIHGHRYDGSRAEQELGIRYTEPRETVRRTVEWARRTGLLRSS